MNKRLYGIPETAEYLSRTGGGVLKPLSQLRHHSLILITHIIMIDKIISLITI